MQPGALLTIKEKPCVSDKGGKKILHKTRQLRGRAKQAAADNVTTVLGGAVQEQAEETVTQHN